MSSVIRKLEKKTRGPRVKHYFTDEVQDWIVKYNNCTCSVEKNEIYVNHLHGPFLDLATGVLVKYNFRMKTDKKLLARTAMDAVTNILLTSIHLYNPKKARAYSYFGTIIKRWSIFKEKQNIHQQNKFYSLDTTKHVLLEKTLNQEPSETVEEIQECEFERNRWFENLNADKFTWPSEDSKKIGISLINFIKNNRTNIDVSRKDMFKKLCKKHECTQEELLSIIDILKKSINSFQI